MKTEAIYITKKNVQRRTISQMILNSKFIGLVAEVLSMILGEKISPKKAIKVLNVQAAIASLMSCCPACLDGACSISMQNVIT